MELYLIVLASAVGFGLPIVAIFASIAQKKVASVALESIGRQPEAASGIQLSLVIGLALIEALVIYVLLAFFLLIGKLPSVEDVLKLSEIQASARVIPAKMLVETASNTLDANGTATTTITVRVFDGSGNPLKGQVIAMTVDSGTITSPAEDNRDGTYTALYTASTQPGKVDIRATAANGMSGSVTITLQ